MTGRMAQSKVSWHYSSFSWHYSSFSWHLEALCFSAVLGRLPGTLRDLAQMSLPPGSPPDFLHSVPDVHTPSRAFPQRPYCSSLLCRTTPPGRIGLPHLALPPQSSERSGRLPNVTQLGSGRAQPTLRQIGVLRPQSDPRAFPAGSAA